MTDIPLPQTSSLPDVFFNRLGQTQTAQTNMLNNILAGIKNKMAQQELSVNPQMLQDKLMANQLANQYQGIVNKYLPQQDVMKLQSGALSNQQQAIINQFLPGMSAAKLKLLNAQANSPALRFGLKNLVGSAAQAMSLEAVKQQYGENSQQYQLSKQAFDSNLNAQNARAKYFGSNVQFKNLPKVAKDQLMNQFQTENAERQKQGAPVLTLDDWWGAQQNQMQTDASSQMNQLNQITGQQQSPANIPTQGTGVAPGEQINVQPDVPAENKAEQSAGTQNQNIKLLTQPDYWTEAQQTSLNLIKETTDADTRKRLRFASNVDATLCRVNKFAPDATSYSHPGGLLELAADKAASLQGKTPQTYQNYINFNKSLDLMKEQLVQFYSLSRMPEKAKEVRELFGTIDFTTNPEQAYNTLMNLEETYDIERQTFVNASTNPELYTKQRAPVAQSLKESFANKQTSGSQPITQEDLDNTAKKYGITVEQVKNRLGLK